MDKKQKEGLVKALLEKGEPYRDIAQKAKVSPNTIKAISNRAGLDETTSISSRAFELFSQGKTPLDVAIKLNLKAEEAVRYHQEYNMLQGCTEFTKLWLQIKNNPWSYVDLVRLVQNAKMGDGEIVELLKIANGYLPRIRLEYDRLQGELNSCKADLDNTVRIYQRFVDQNILLKRREDELLHNISKLEAREAELQKTTTELEQHISKLTGNADTINLNPEVKQEDVIPTNDVLTPQTDTSISYHQNENEMQAQAEPPFKIVSDTKDLFRGSSSSQV